MKKLISSFLLFNLLWLASFTSLANEIKLMFLYPGGQGSQEQAQPLLDELSQALHRASEGKINTKIIYLSDLEQGEKFFNAQKPAGGILAYHVFLAKQQDWKTQQIAQSLQLPSADGKNQYFVLGKKQDIDQLNPAIIYTSLPIKEEYFRRHLFTQLKAPIDLKVTKNLVGKLRSIGNDQEPEALVLLDQFEKETIAKLKTPWSKNLEVLLESKKVPSAPFVVFSDNLTPEQTQELKSALTKLGKDKKAKLTLENLRIKGFQ